MRQPARIHGVRTALAARVSSAARVTDNDEAMGDAVPVEERTEGLDVIESALGRRRHHAENCRPLVGDMPFVSQTIRPSRRRKRVAVGSAAARRSTDRGSSHRPPGDAEHLPTARAPAGSHCRTSEGNGTLTTRATGCGSRQSSAARARRIVSVTGDRWTLPTSGSPVKCPRYRPARPMGPAVVI